MSRLISNFKFQISNYKRNKGFTLIELIVVMAVFLLIMGTAISIFISIVSHQKRILAKQELLNQTSYFIEYMGKGLRMAVKDPDGVCLGTVGAVYKLEDYDSVNRIWKGIKFINASDDNACQKFCLDNSTLENPVLKEIKNSAGNWDCGTGTNVTSTNLKINLLSFAFNGVLPGPPAGINDGYVVPLSDSDLNQPRVTIALDVKIQGDSNQLSTKIQTTVSQRDLNK